MSAMAVEWIVCGREDRLPQPDLLAHALATVGTLAEAARSSPDEVALALRYEQCRGSLAFRLAPGGLPSPSSDVAAPLAAELRAARVAAKLDVPLERGRERHGALWAARIAGVLAEHLEGPLLDVRSERAWTLDAVRKVLVGRAFDVRNHVTMVGATDDKDRVWLRTQGLDALGQPELMLPGVRSELRGAAEEALALAADQIIGRAPAVAGEQRAVRGVALALVAPARVYAHVGRDPSEAPEGLVLVPAASGAEVGPGDVERLLAALAARGA
jgi:hypothetical protein